MINSRPRTSSITDNKEVGKAIRTMSSLYIRTDWSLIVCKKRAVLWEGKRFCDNNPASAKQLTNEVGKKLNSHSLVLLQNNIVIMMNAE